MTTTGTAEKGFSTENAAALYRLMTWLSPSFPVGAFAYSSGIEWAVEARDISDAASTRDWLDVLLTNGSGWCDAVFLAHAHRETSAARIDALGEAAELAAAFVTSRERQLETLTQGRAFLAAAQAAWGLPAIKAAADACGEAVAYPIAVGIVAAAHDVPLAPTLHAYLHALTANWISAAARLVPLGQSDCQRLLASLEPIVHAVADRARAASLDDLGSATFRADIAAMRHETQYTRLFRS